MNRPGHGKIVKQFLYVRKREVADKGSWPYIESAIFFLMLYLVLGFVFLPEIGDNIHLFPLFFSVIFALLADARVHSVYEFGIYSGGLAHFLAFYLSIIIYAVIIAMLGSATLSGWF